MATRERIFCPKCRGLAAVTKSGKIRKHKNCNMLRWVGNPPNMYRDYPICEASGRLSAPSTKETEE